MKVCLLKVQSYTYVMCNVMRTHEYRSKGFVGFIFDLTFMIPVRRNLPSFPFLFFFRFDEHFRCITRLSITYVSISIHTLTSLTLSYIYIYIYRLLNL